ncbi:hypothetical protein M513_00659 [Trichuris suis]|uniref:Uncharacterized protein n=1 Tax=Trichuris suis TaxID=68888 RepID=A0A085MMI7_9BILA|nr:hypothetical protein M513_00659 [Trichuris suis]
MNGNNLVGLINRTELQYALHVWDCDWELFKHNSLFIHNSKTKERKHSNHTSTELEQNNLNPYLSCLQGKRYNNAIHATVSLGSYREQCHGNKRRGRSKIGQRFFITAPRHANSVGT